MLELSEDTVVSLDEPKGLIFDSRLLAKLPYKNRQFAQVVSRHTGEQVVHCLEVETTVEEVQPFGTRYVDSSAQLTLSKDLSWPKI